MRISDCGLRIYYWPVAMFLAASVTLAVAQAPGQTPGGPSVLDQPSPAITASPLPSVSPSATPTPTPTPAPSPSPSIPRPAKSIRISFLPPPLEGTISLGIYDDAKKLVRVLHQEADLDEFVIGDDALSTKWDGRSDEGLDLPPGHYQARGFVVGKLKNEVAVLPAASPSPTTTPGTNKIAVRLMPNPLANDERVRVELAVGFDHESSFLKTLDGLPLYTISDQPNVQRAGITKTGERAADVWQDDGATLQQFRLSNLNQMMAFDCGDFELK